MVAAADMFSRIRKRADLESTAYIDDQTELGPLCEESVFDLWDFLLAALGDEAPWERTTLNTTASQEYIDIPNPSGVYRLLRVDFQPATGLAYVPLMRGNVATDALDALPRAWGGGVTGPRYYARRTRRSLPSPNYFGWRVYFDPIPSAVYPVRFFYAPVPNIVMSGVNYTSFPDEWPEYIVADVCAKLAAKQESDPAPFEAERERIRTRIERYTRPHNQSGPSFIADQRRHQPDNHDHTFDGFWERR